MTTRRVPFDVEALITRSTSGRCFVCEFLSGNPDYAHTLVAETGDAVAFLSKYPTLFGQVLVAPKRHVEQVTGDFTEAAYLELQRFVYRVAEAMRRVLAPERVYVLSLGSQAANAHVHWHIAPLPPGIPLAQQQYHALMHENGAIDADPIELAAYVRDLRAALGQGSGRRSKRERTRCNQEFRPAHRRCWNVRATEARSVRADRKGRLFGGGEPGAADVGPRDR